MVASASSSSEKGPPVSTTAVSSSVRGWKFPERNAAACSPKSASASRGPATRSASTYPRGSSLASRASTTTSSSAASVSTSTVDDPPVDTDTATVARDVSRETNRLGSLADARAPRARAPVGPADALDIARAPASDAHACADIATRLRSHRPVWTAPASLARAAPRRHAMPTWRCVGNLVRSLHAERRHSPRRGTDFSLISLARSPSRDRVSDCLLSARDERAIGATSTIHSVPRFRKCSSAPRCFLTAGKK